MEKKMKVINALSIFLDQNPGFKVSTSFSSYYSHKVLEFQAERPNEVTVIGRDRHGLHCCWVLKPKENLAVIK